MGRVEKKKNRDKQQSESIPEDQGAALPTKHKFRGADTLLQKFIRERNKEEKKIPPHLPPDFSRSLALKSLAERG